MRLFVAASILALSVHGVSALPSISSGALHVLEKRDAVCGIDFRRGVDNASCLRKGASYTLTPPSTITKATVKTAPAGSQCDHTVELQLLDKVLKRSGMCAVLAAMNNAGVTKATLLQPAFDTISSDANINFLAAAVNNRKKTVISRSLNNKRPAQPDDLDRAVSNYLQQTMSESNPVASSLDKNVAKILSDAKAKLATLPDGKRGSKEQKIKSALNEAIEQYKGTDTTSKAWEKVLKDAQQA